MEDGFMQIAREFAKAERELGVERWVHVSYEMTDDNGSSILLHTYDIPNEQYEQRAWVVEWRKAKLICEYPRNNVRMYISFYDKKCGEVLGFNSDLMRLICLKGQVVRSERMIAEYIQNNRNSLFFDEEKDPQLLSAQKKMKERKQRLLEAEKELEQKVIHHKNLNKA